MGKREPGENFNVDRKIRRNSDQRSVEIIIYIDEKLDFNQRVECVEALQDTDGITDAVFYPLRNHLMTATYDRDVLSCHDVIATIRSNNINARLIGPIEMLLNKARRRKHRRVANVTQ
jgi:hypothetical protein